MSSMFNTRAGSCRHTSVQAADRPLCVLPLKPLQPALHHDVIITQLLPATNWDVMLSTQLAGARETP